MLAGLALALLVALVPAPGRADVSRTHSITVDGRARNYRLYRPASLPQSQPAPLVLSLHGGFGSGAHDEAAYGWDARADEAGFVVVYPDGVGHSWNAGACCGPASRQQVDDVAFLTKLVERLIADGTADRRRIFVAGMSNGAAMAYRLACESRLPIAALGIVAGGLSVPCATPQPVAVLAIHGSDDRNIPVAGGVGAKAFAPVDWPPLADVMALWRHADRCADTAARRDGALVIERAKCDDGRAVTLITVEGAGHQWPGGKPVHPGVARLLMLDPPSGALDATAVLWDFFSRHAQPA